MDYTTSQIIEAKITNWLQSDSRCRQLLNAANNVGGFKACKEFAKRMAGKYSALINENFNFDTIADELPELRQTLMNLRDRAASTTAISVDRYNKRQGINVAAQTAKQKTDSIDNLCKRISEGTIANDGSISKTDKFLTDDSVIEHIAGEAVDDTIKDNAEFMEDAGIKTTFIRHLGADGCCEYCQNLAGTYTEDDLPDDFWMMHDNCDCWIEYKSEKVHTKITYGRNSAGSKYKNTENL